MRALSIRQPYAELILRATCGEQIKPIEFRSRPTKRIGHRKHSQAVSGKAEDSEASPPPFIRQIG